MTDDSAARALHGALPQRVLLTGASRGIGAAIARALIASGARLAVIGRQRAALEAVVGDTTRHAVLVADLERPDAAAACVDQAAAALGGLDGFVSCAGIVEYAGVSAISTGSIERQLAVNLVAPLLLAQRAAPVMQRSGGGAMLFVASTLGLKPVPLTTVYSASKAALISVARALALELAGSAIRVNAIAPGVVDTDMVRVVRLQPGEAMPDAAEAARRIERQLEELRALHPLGRLGRTEEVAESALYLLRAPFVTGTVLTIDGGISLGTGVP
jgi:NAD(P)-dependent dehydrogenase (short-subunit alcohol dehydrogenase family)